ncbi:MAG: NAD-dependent dehydratase [Magnetovibrio sp.]|nr:NAD-dependent dehydratase [Magnetovibrio sp.]|tara:strand:- start:724 stop:1716 length:993 start_codon:yes stop_codon:yes gene_type:complete
MKCLVTGGAGFIGSHLTERLLEDGHKVVVLDNFSTGRPENLDNLPFADQLMIVEADIQNQDLIMPAFKDVDWVFHMAALADIVPSIEQPLAYHGANVNGTISVLEASRRHGVKRFVYAASSSCYGIPEFFPTREDAPMRPRYPYALTKMIGEQYVMHWERVFGLSAVSLRMFNVFGPRSRTSGTYGAVFGVFLAQKLAGKPFTVVGDGTQTRDFTFVTDVVDAFVSTAASNLRGEIMNIGSGNTYSINFLVELLGGDVVYIPKRPGEPDCTFADTTLIKEKLNWSAIVSFEEGTQTMLKNIEYWREAPVWCPATIGEATRGWFKYLGEND